MSNLAVHLARHAGAQTCRALFVAIGIDNVACGFAGTCLIAYMSSLTALGFTATQYALFSSLYALPGRLIASQSGRIVESAAHSADSGGVFSPLNGLFTGLPPESFAQALQKSGVGPASLGSGYTVFFLYSTLVGIFAVVLTFVLVLGRKVPDRGAPPTAREELRPFHSRQLMDSVQGGQAGHRRRSHMKTRVLISMVIVLIAGGFFLGRTSAQRQAGPGARIA